MTESRLDGQGRFRLAAAVSGLMLAGVCGCPHRTVYIDCETAINTGPSQNGSPMDLDVVSVFPKNLSGDDELVNEPLRIDDSGDDARTRITSKDWFERKPTPSSMGDENDTYHFRLDKKQIMSFTAQTGKDFYGTARGGQIQGRKYWNAKQEHYVVQVPIDDIWDKRSVIYVFGKFVDSKGNALPTPPAFFWRVGDYKDEIYVRVGANGVVRVDKATFQRGVKREGEH